MTKQAIEYDTVDADCAKGELAPVFIDILRRNPPQVMTLIGLREDVNRCIRTTRETYPPVSYPEFYGVVGPNSLYVRAREAALAYLCELLVDAGYVFTVTVP